MMIDKPESVDEAPRDADDEGVAAGASVNDRESKISMPVDESVATIALLEETLTVSKQHRATGRVRVTTETDVIEAMAEVELDRYRIEVTRVPVGCVVDEAPLTRAEGDTTIIPVLEERFVVVKQLFLVEEVRVRKVLQRDVVSEPVTLRRQRALVEHLDADGSPTRHDGVQSE